MDFAHLDTHTFGVPIWLSLNYGKEGKEAEVTENLSLALRDGWMCADGAKMETS